MARHPEPMRLEAPRGSAHDRRQTGAAARHFAVGGQGDHYAAFASVEARKKARQHARTSVRAGRRHAIKLPRLEPRRFRQALLDRQNHLEALNPLSFGSIQALGLRLKEKIFFFPPPHKTSPILLSLLSRAG